MSWKDEINKKIIYLTLHFFQLIDHQEHEWYYYCCTLPWFVLQHVKNIGNQAIELFFLPSLDSINVNNKRKQCLKANASNEHPTARVVWLGCTRHPVESTERRSESMANKNILDHPTLQQNKLPKRTTTKLSKHVNHYRHWIILREHRLVIHPYNNHFIPAIPSATEVYAKAEKSFYQKSR